MNSVSVTDRSGRQVEFVTKPGERILHAGLLAGVGLPFECASGTCGACKARWLAGDVTDLWPKAPGRKVIRAPDEILMCQTSCTSPTELELRGSFALPPEPSVQRLQGVLRRVNFLTDEVALFELDLDAPIDCLPGQFALLGVDDAPGFRAYSMTRYSPNVARLNFLVRKLPGGGFSSVLFAPAFEPRQIKVIAPLGRAVFRPEERRPFLAIAGGSGIAGMLSILDCAERVGHYIDCPSEVVFGLRDPTSAYVLDVLDEAAKASGGALSITVAFSHSEPSSVLLRQYPNLRFTAGFVHQIAMDRADHMRDREPTYFVAGPPPMVDATIRGLVVDRKISPTEIRYDRFG